MATPDRQTTYTVFHKSDAKIQITITTAYLTRIKYTLRVDFVEICKVYVGKMIIKAAKRIFNSDKICRSYSDLNFGVTLLEHSDIFVFFAVLAPSVSKYIADSVVQGG